MDTQGETRRGVLRSLPLKIGAGGAGLLTAGSALVAILDSDTFREFTGWGIAAESSPRVGVAATNASSNGAAPAPARSEGGAAVVLTVRGDGTRAVSDVLPNLQSTLRRMLGSRNWAGRAERIDLTASSFAFQGADASLEVAWTVAGENFNGSCAPRRFRYANIAELADRVADAIESDLSASQQGEGLTCG